MSAPLSRRRLLKLGAVGSGLAAATAGSGLVQLPQALASSVSGQSGTDGPAFADGASEVTMQSAQQASFEGEHQLAVLSEPTPYTAMVAFDVIAETRAELRDLLRSADQPDAAFVQRWFAPKRRASRAGR